MSYNCTISFTHIAPEDVFQFMTDIKKACTERLEAIAKDEYGYCPFVRNSLVVNRDFANGITKEQKEEAKAWAHSLFKWKIFYNQELGLLGMMGLPNALHDLFDGTVYFQDSCDQDYDEKAWEGIRVFEVLYSKYMQFSDDHVKKIYESKRDETFDEMMKDDYPDATPEIVKEKLDYYRRTFCYDKIWSYFSQYLWDESKSVFMSVYGNYEVREIYSFIKFCHMAQIAFEDDNMDVFGPAIKKKQEAQKVSIEEVDDLLGGLMDEI